MSGWPRSVSVRSMTREAFNVMLHDYPEALAARIRHYGKPRVRVPAGGAVVSFFDCGECGARRGDAHRPGCVSQRGRDAARPEPKYER